MGGMRAVGYASEQGDHQPATAADRGAHVLPGQRPCARGYGELVPQGTASKKLHFNHFILITRFYLHLRMFTAARCLCSFVCRTLTAHTTHIGCKRYKYCVVAVIERLVVCVCVQDLPEIGIASEHGYRIKQPGESSFTVTYPNLDFGWKDIVRPIMQMYADSTDGSNVQEKECGLTWAYSAADPDFGRWQVLCIYTPLPPALHFPLF